ncbi:MAG: SDR family NAD(P)-dependent oxidoreductase [Patescibacteria group bacterium]
MASVRTAVITGASRGIGLATAQKFFASGWRVVGTYNATLIPIDSPELIPISLDASVPASIARASAEIAQHVSSIDVLVNNAGIILDALDSDIDMDKIRKTFEVDLFAVIDLTERLLPLMHAGSHIININSSYGALSLPIDDESSTAYRLAKAALNMYTRTLAFRLRGRKIIVSSLDPGWVKTDMGRIAATEEDGPDREPEEPAGEIYDLATRHVPSGHFWRKGKKRAW